MERMIRKAEILGLDEKNHVSGSDRCPLADEFKYNE